MSNSVFDNSQIDNNKHSNSVNQIYEQEKALYLSKLKRHTSNLRKNQIVSIVLFFIDLWICYICSAITAGVFTYVATKWFKKIVEKGNLIYFVWYCLIVGTLVILFL